MKNDTLSIVQARAIELPQAAEAPEWIMYLPGGKHHAEATVNGQPEGIDYTVTEATAQALQAHLQTLLEAGGPEPFFSFDHDPGTTRASAWPREFAWKDGAVQCRVRWTPAGSEAVTVKSAEQLPAYRWFSPSFRFDRKTKSIVAMDQPEAGSLVNDPAFRSIARITAAAPKTVAAPAVLNPTKNQMDYEKLAKAACAALGMTDEEAAGENAVEILTSKVDAMKTAPASTKAAHTRVQAALTKAEETITALNTKLASEAIAVAVQAGRIAPQDEETLAFWTGSLTRDYDDSVKALRKLPPLLPKESGATQPGAKEPGADKAAAEKVRYGRIQARAAEISNTERIGWSAAFARAEAEIPPA